MSTDDFDTTPGDDQVFAGLRRSVGPATLSATADDVAALGRRTRTRHRAVAAGIGTGAAALVAAIGVLAPSAGTGGGTTPNVVARTTVTTTSGAQTLTIQDAGFTLEEHADGTVHLTFQQAVDPALLKAAMDKAGIPSAVLVQQVPTIWKQNDIVQCTPTAAVHDDDKAGASAIQLVDDRHSPYAYVITKSAIPAGDVVTLIQFKSPATTAALGQTMMWFGLKTGRQATCVPEWASLKQHSR